MPPDLHKRRRAAEQCAIGSTDMKPSQGELGVKVCPQGIGTGPRHVCPADVFASRGALISGYLSATDWAPPVVIDPEQIGRKVGRRRRD